MKLFNNTPGQVYYGIDSASSGDCGVIESQGTSADLTGYDNSQNVSVYFAAYPFSNPPEITPFKITIPASGTGMTVTIGISQE
jgi:hypothetical protein